MEDHHGPVVQSCGGQARPSARRPPQLAAERSASRKPDRGPAQVNRQLPGADRGHRKQHRQTELGRLLARVGAPALDPRYLTLPTAGRPPRTGAGAGDGTRRMAAVKAAASSSATARGAAGAVRGAARRRPGHRPRGGDQRRAVPPHRRTRIWSLMRLERQLRPEAYGPRRGGGYLDRRRTPTADT
jgi:hypothetical protein